MTHTRPRPTVYTAALLLIAATATAAFGHAAFDEQSVPADTDATLHLRVPIEKAAYNEKITAEVPGGFTVRSCEHVTNWTCAVTPPGPARSATVVTWTRQGSVDLQEYFDFAVRTPATPAVYRVEVNQTYSDGSTVHWDGADGSGFPAATLTVTGKGTPVVSASARPPSHGTHPPTPSPTSSARPPATPSASPASPAPSQIAAPATAPTTAAPTASASGSATPTIAAEPAATPTRSIWPVLLAALGVAGAGAAAARAVRRRRAAPPT